MLKNPRKEHNYGIITCCRNTVCNNSFLFLEQERVKRQEELDKKEKNREQLQYKMLKAIDGSLALSEAIAKAVQRIPDAKCNGDMHSALDYEKNAKHDLENFLNMQAVDHITGGAR